LFLYGSAGMRMGRQYRQQRCFYNHWLTIRKTSTVRVLKKV
jgi:hypothetical protein